MSKFFQSSVATAAVVFSLAVNAENLMTNGSFETKGACRNYAALQKKGFKLNFKKNAWLKKWMINAATKKAEVTVTTADDAQDGKKYIEVKNGKYVHIYQDKKLPGEFKYKMSFFAKAPAGANVIEICAYVYNAKTHRYVTGKQIKKFSPTGKWQKFSLDIPQFGEDKEIMLAFAIKGNCSLDNVTLAMQE